MFKPAVCVVGLGYVGLPLAVELAKHFRVAGFDINERRIDLLKQGRIPTERSTLKRSEA